MGVHNPYDEIGSRVQNYVDHPDDAAARELVQQSLERSGVMYSKEALGELNRRLEDAGLLPKFLQAEFSHIDGQGYLFADGRLTREELASAQGSGNDATTKLAAQYGARNYGNLRIETDFLESLTNGFNSENIQSYDEKQHAAGLARNPYEMFSGSLEDGNSGSCKVSDSSFFTSNDKYGRAGEMLGRMAIPGSNPNADELMQRVKGGYGGSKEGHQLQQNFKGGSDADFGPGRVCIDGKEGYRVGDREFVKNDRGNWQYTIRKGDTLDGITRQILRDRNGCEPSVADVQRVSKIFEEHNGYNRGGRSRDRIYANDTMLIPKHF